jgi:hypothetical protein
MFARGITALREKYIMDQNPSQRNKHRHGGGQTRDLQTELVQRHARQFGRRMARKLMLELHTVVGNEQMYVQKFRSQFRKRCYLISRVQPITANKTKTKNETSMLKNNNNDSIYICDRMQWPACVRPARPRR